MKKGIGCLIIIVLLIAAGLFLTRFILGALNGSSDDSESGTDNTVEQEMDNYTQVYFDDIAGDLADGIDSAKSKYINKKVIIVGRFDKMNSDGEAKIEGVTEDCVVISDNGGDNNDTLWVVGHMQTDEQREKFKEFSNGDPVVIAGTITDITETAVFMDIDNME